MDPNAELVNTPVTYPDDTPVGIPFQNSRVSTRDAGDDGMTGGTETVSGSPAPTTQPVQTATLPDGNYTLQNYEGNNVVNNLYHQLLKFGGETYQWQWTNAPVSSPYPGYVYGTLYQPSTPHGAGWLYMNDSDGGPSFGDTAAYVCLKPVFEGASQVTTWILATPGGKLGACDKSSSYGGIANGIGYYMNFDNNSPRKWSFTKMS
ncbi:hypothetical protein 4 [Hubei tombus-like virus 1]|uniref:hypothetical protein 4 n=1 Tax=Hubei tombus-like virus 1 TaxID=1923255 RepID=UPI000909C6EB|nr:hypothetical protein 4 [Hubei tombus-like virus 1]APG76569.1 hypothetical protein 4 [Hubei tombus-like virus 1]